MKRTQVQIREDQLEWLRAQASARGVSVSHLIREGVAVLRAREERISKEKKQRALNVVGSFSSGISDISVRHDDYLAEIYRGNTHGEG